MGTKHIPILMYHRITRNGEGEPSSFVVNARVFERQLQFFSEHGYYTPRLADVSSTHASMVSSARKPLIITFDDGYLDTLEQAAPLLRKYGFSAIVFILPGLRTNSWDAPKGIAEAKLMETNQYLELREMGIEIGSHGWSHRSLPLLGDEELENELTQSKRVAEELLKQPIEYFAYPYGEVDERVKKAVRNAGYVCAFATNSGPMSFHGDLFQIRRSIVCNNADGLYLYKKLSRVEKIMRVGWSVAKQLMGRRPSYNKVSGVVERVD